MIQLEWYQAILIVIAIVGTVGALTDGPDPAELERKERVTAAYNSAMRRFANVAEDEEVTTVPGSVSASKGGLGNGSAAEKKR
jgi:hypothetical protein